MPSIKHRLTLEEFLAMPESDLTYELVNLYQSSTSNGLAFGGIAVYSPEGVWGSEATK